jgi:hypothetical protein
MDRTTVLEIIKMIDTTIEYKREHLPTDSKYSCYNAIGQDTALRELKRNLLEHIRQGKPSCNYCKSIGRDCYCCTADE